MTAARADTLSLWQQLDFSAARPLINDIVVGVALGTAVVIVGVVAWALWDTARRRAAG